MISVKHVPVYLPYTVFHNEVRCSAKLFCGNIYIAVIGAKGSR